MYSLNLIVIEEGYNFQYGDNILEQQLSKGLPRQRSNFIGAPHQVSINVLCENDAQVQDLWTLYRVNQSKPNDFKVKMQGDHGILEDFSCRFQMGKPPTESSRSGNIIIYQLMLWVKPINRSLAADEARLLVNSVGTSMLETIDQISNAIAPETVN